MRRPHRQSTGPLVGGILIAGLLAVIGASSAVACRRGRAADRHRCDLRRPPRRRLVKVTIQRRRPIPHPTTPEGRTYFTGLTFAVQPGAANVRRRIRRRHPAARGARADGRVHVHRPDLPPVGLLPARSIATRSPTTFPTPARRRTATCASPRAWSPSRCGPSAARGERQQRQRAAARRATTSRWRRAR